MTDWDARYESGDTPWDKGSAAPPLLEILDRHGVEPWGDGPVLVPGCGTGHDVRALAAAGLNVVGLDVSELAVLKASAYPKVADEVYELGDFLDPAWAMDRSFSALWEHTCFCAIPVERRNDYARSAAAVLMPGGLLAGVFFLTPFDPGDAETGPPFPTTIEEINAWFSPWFDQVDAWVPERAFPGREGREWIAIFRKLAQPRIAPETSSL